MEVSGLSRWDGGSEARPPELYSMPSMERRSWEIELQCPQCGAPVTLEETDRLLACSYCHVKLYLWTSGPFCTCLPALRASGEALFYIPYWRFRGIAFSAIPYEVRHRMVDATLLAYPHRALPHTLGIRPQAMTLRFVSGEIQGRFIKPRMALGEAVMKIQNQFGDLEGSLLGQTPFQRQFIGELGSLIFFPVFIRNRAIVDGILGRVIGPEKDSMIEEASSGTPDHWQVKPLSTLCPNCGNSLLGSRESLILFCKICHIAWNPSSGALQADPFAVLPGKKDSSVHLPFWRVKPDIKGIVLKSFADLARAANLPKMIRPEWEDQEFYFWIPAFRVHPSLFLRLSRQMTLFQSLEQTEPVLPDTPFHPVTLSDESAAASLKIHLAHLLSKKREVFPKLDEISVRPVKRSLVFVPFNTNGREWIHPRLGIGLQKKTLSL